MSRSEWEQGTITLPTAAVAPLKQALRQAHNEMFDAVLAVAKRWEPLYVDQKPRRGYVVIGLPEPRTQAERHARAGDQRPLPQPRRQGLPRPPRRR